MPIEIIPKPKSKKIYWAILALSVCLVLIVAGVAAYFYMDSSAKRVSQQIEEKKKALEFTPEETALQNEMLFYENKINVFGKLLSDHSKAANVFDFLEKKCHPDIRFSNFNFDAKKTEVKVSGTAKNFIALEQQILILNAESILKKITLSEVSLGEKGDVKFGLLLDFDPQILKQ